MEHYFTEFEVALIIVSGAAFFYGVAHAMWALTAKYGEDLV